MGQSALEGKIKCVRFVKVISIKDDTESDRIQVRLTPEDNDRSDAELPYAFPLLPKMLHIKPKVGEAVLLFLTITNDGNSQRYYIGPIISQDHRIYKDPFFEGADSYLLGSIKKFDVAPGREDLVRAVLPRDEDIVIRGRKNADIQITDDDVRIKAGVKVVNENFNYDMAFNKKNPSYLKLKYHTQGLKDGSKSSAAVVGDKIFLLSNTSPVNFELTDTDDLITDNELSKVIESAYKLPYGEKLVDFLKTFVEAFNKHTHKFNMLPPDPFHTATLNTKSVDLLDDEGRLSNTVRIN